MIANPFNDELYFMMFGGQISGVCIIYVSFFYDFNRIVWNESEVGYNLTSRSDMFLKLIIIKRGK